ncbi:MAG TPA: ABC transporter substrate-binding protein [Verrucomicrobiae bacterium]|jgi:branched-chain amino acid transport system substrate-binding protein|nr:ABC transporter substrate-binding protein [Verrucomicrobiae bacterium]
MKRKPKFWSVGSFVAALSLLLLADGCAPKNSSNNATDIKVGEFASLTGKEATFGQSSHHGTELAINEINAQGGVLGRKLQLLTEDDQSKAGEAKTIAQKLISRDGVVALLGEVASKASLEAAPICQENKIPQISPSSTNPKVTETGDYIFRVCFIDSVQGKALAHFARETLKAKKVAVLTDVATAYSVGLATYFKEAFVVDGGEIAVEQKYSGGDRDFKGQLTTIKAADAEALFVPGYYTDVGLIARQARELGLTYPLFGGDGWEAPELIQIGGAAVEGCFYSTHYSPEVKDPAVVKFVAAFQAKYGSVPDAMAALGYDSAMLLADAMKRAGTTDGPKLRDALAATKDFPGVAGKITIDAHRDAQKPLVILEVTNGGFHLLKQIAAE